MITTALKEALTAAGCTLVLSEAPALANIQADRSAPTDIIGIVLEPTTLTISTKGNGIQEQYPPVTVEILKQCAPESPNEVTEPILDELLTTCKQFIYLLIRTGDYAKLPDVPATKVNENRYDANVVGWSLALTLKPVVNANKC